MELSELLSQLVEAIEEKYGYFKDLADYEAWRESIINEYVDSVYRLFSNR